MNSSFHFQGLSAGETAEVMESPRRSERIASRVGDKQWWAAGTEARKNIIPCLTFALIGMTPELYGIYSTHTICCALLEHGVVDTAQEACEWLRRNVTERTDEVYAHARFF